jgi:response regulator NasT
MGRSLRIVVADDEPDMRDYFRRILPRLGHQVVAAAENGRALVDRCRALKPDLVITDIKMPDMDGIDAAVQIYREMPIPVILVSAYHDAALIARAEADHILGYLVKPIKQADLEPTIALVMSRFEQLQKLLHEATDFRQALADRQVVERAKAILARREKVDESEAFQQLQSAARERTCKLVEAAQGIVREEESKKGPAQG